MIDANFAAMAYHVLQAHDADADAALAEAGIEQFVNSQQPTFTACFKTEIHSPRS